MEECPVKAEVKADLTEAGTELAKGMRGGGSMLMEALFGRRLAEVRAHAERTQAQSAADAELIAAGLARYENGQIVYLADTAACAKFLVHSKDERRRAENLAACLDEAVNGIDKDPVFSLPGKDIDPDFLDDWQDTAERTNSEYMRRLWGRILKGELKQPGKYSRRVLNILRNLTVEEAQAFTYIARYAIDSIVVLTEDDFKKFLDMSSLLYDSWLFVGSNKRVVSYTIDSKFAALPLCDCAIILHFSDKLSGMYNLCSGYQLSHAGKSILDIPDVEPIQQWHLKKMFSVLKKDIPSLVGLTAHPGDRYGYNKDYILCEYREETGSADGR